MKDSFCGQCGKPLGEPGERRFPIEEVKRNLDGIRESVDLIGLLVIVVLSFMAYALSGDVEWVFFSGAMVVLFMALGIVAIVKSVKCLVRSKKEKSK